MDLELSDEEAALRDNVRSVLAGICPPAVVRSIFDGAEPPAILWARMVELGWPALAIDEAHGGLGLGFVELTLVAEELGRAVAPGPYLATTTQCAPALRELGGELGDDTVAGPFLAAIAAGTTTGTLALAEAGRWTLDAVRTTARRHGSGWVIDGEKAAVLDGATADEIVVIARGDGGLGAFVVAGADAGVKAAPRPGFDPTMPLADLRLDGVVVDATRVLAAPDAPHVERALARAVQQSTVATAAMMAGACRAILERTVEYAKEREQYGRPIGSFQALKHRLVEMYLALERSSALVYYAALAIAEDAPDRATAAAGDGQRLIAEDGLQLHGGIGFTWEHDLHFLLKRAKAGDALFGNAVAQRAKLVELLDILPAGDRGAA